MIKVSTATPNQKTNDEAPRRIARVDITLLI